MLLASLTGAACAGAGESRPPAPELELLGEVRIAPEPLIEGTPRIGGLSSLFWVGDDDYLVVSDDRGDYGPARFYRFAIDVGDGRLDDGDVRLTNWTELRDADGAPLAPGSYDLEGLVAFDGHLFLSSEGNANAGVAPFVAQFDADGHLIERLALPPGWSVGADATSGIRNNLALESLAITPDGRYLFTANESALLQDGPEATATSGSPARISRFDRQRGVFDRQYLYEVEPVHTSTPDDDLEVTGLVDLIALADDYLLALERSFVARATPQHSVKLFEVCLSDADDIAAIPSLAAAPAPPTPVRKRFLGDVADFVERLDNIEGFAFGPPLPTGERLLMLVSDDNFAPQRQVTQFLAFAVPDGVLRGCN